MAPSPETFRTLSPFKAHAVRTAGVHQDVARVERFAGSLRTVKLRSPDARSLWRASTTRAPSKVKSIL